MAIDFVRTGVARRDRENRSVSLQLDRSVDVFLGEGDAFAEQGEFTVGSDVANDFDSAFGGEPFGRVVTGRQARAEPVGPHLVGG